MKPRAGRRALERIAAAGDEPRNNAGEYVAGARRGEIAVGIRVDENAPVRRGDDRVSPLQEDDAACLRRSGARAGQAIARDLAKQSCELAVMGRQDVARTKAVEEGLRPSLERRQRIRVKNDARFRGEYGVDQIAGILADPGPPARQ